MRVKNNCEIKGDSSENEPCKANLGTVLPIRQ